MTNQFADIRDDGLTSIVGTDKYRPYPAYKDSGADWLGEVPEHWGVQQLGRIGRFFKGSGGTKADARKDGIPCIRYGDLYTQHQFFISSSRACVTPELAKIAYTPIEYGDVLFAGSGETIDEIGKSAVNLIRSQACCGGDVIIFRPSIDIDARFFGYATDCPAAVRQKACMGRGFTVIHIYSSELKCLAVSLPPLPEQRAIAAFLDRETAQIDALVAKKERLIELLQEKRTALITQAVTKGLDSDIPMKDSGVEWLGEIPVHWEVKRLKTISRIRYGLGQPPRELSKGLPLIRATNVTRGRITKEDMVYVDPDDVPIGRDAFLAEGEIIVVRSGAYTADSAIIPKAYDGAVTGYDMVVTVNNALAEFVAVALLCTYVRDAQLVICSMRSAQPHLNAEELGAAVILLPPLPEQRAIAAFLDRETAKIDALDTKVRKVIDLLKELRTALISAAVTGKIDVREAMA